MPAISITLASLGIFNPAEFPSAVILPFYYNRLIAECLSAGAVDYLCMRKGNYRLIVANKAEDVLAEVLGG